MLNLLAGVNAERKVLTVFQNFFLWGKRLLVGSKMKSDPHMVMEEGMNIVILRRAGMLTAAVFQ